MEIREIQKESFNLLKQINKKLNIEHNPDSVFLHLAEEVGEVARELSRKRKNWREDFDKNKLAEELVDVLMDISIIAEDNNIDLSIEFPKKLNKDKERFKIK